MGGKPKKILIMEDERPLVKALEFKLKAAGFDVAVAYDGEEGLQKVSAESCDLVLLDLIMPKKDGFAVLEEMKAKGIKCPVIALTNLSQKEDLEKVKSFGVNEYLVKSDTSLSEVVEKIRSFFKEKS